MGRVFFGGFLAGCGLMAAALALLDPAYYSRPVLMLVKGIAGVVVGIALARNGARHVRRLHGFPE